MGYDMEWSRLLSAARHGHEGEEPGLEERRSGFERDFDRIVFSSAFRRLQNKTQVFPLPETDFIHTRLTHSLETSSIGRSLGKMTGEALLTELDSDNAFFKEQNIQASDFASIVAAASLAHDIGNPPFGHSGEDAISNFFQQEGREYLKGLTDKQQTDLCNFEGNALGFRKLVNTYPGLSSISGGMRLTYATLGAFTKYPRESLVSESDKTKASEKKYGFFQSERDDFKQVAEKLGLISTGTAEDYKWKRHPLAYLMEAADDICYNIIDLEDGCSLNLVSFDSAKKLLFVNELNDQDQKQFARILDPHEQLGYLRAKAINRLITEAVTVFKENYEGIMNGSFDTSLCDKVASVARLEEIKRISRKQIYGYKEVIEIEAAGFEVIGGLIGILLESVLNTTHKNLKHKKILQLVPGHFYEDSSGRLEDKYIQIIHILDFIASMTDRQALSMFRKLKGISLPSLRG